MGTVELYHIMGIIWTVAAGFILHFTYEWFDRRKSVAWFSAVNESIWEHLKLFFFPALLWSITEFFTYGMRLPGFWPVKALFLAAGVLLIPLLYYGYTGLTGRNFLWADIGVFILSVLLAYGISHLLMKSQKVFSSLLWQITGFIIIAALIFAFVRFTYKAPDLPVFRDNHKTNE